MADFSEMCPLFETGVFKEIMIPAVPMTYVTACGNAMLGLLTFSKPGYFTFGRTVVIVSGFIRNIGKTVEGTMQVQLRRHSDEVATGTIFATFTISVTGDSQTPQTWLGGTFTEKTFTSTDLLGIAPEVGTR